MKTGRITETVQTVSTLVEDISDTDSQVQAAVEAAAAAVDGLAEALADEENEVEACTENICESFDASPVDDETEVEGQTEIAANASVENVAVEGGPQATGDAVSADAPLGHGAMVGADDKVSKKDLVSLLEGFVRIIKTDEESTVSPGDGGLNGVGVDVTERDGHAGKRASLLIENDSANRSQRRLCVC